MTDFKQEAAAGQTMACRLWRMLFQSGPVILTGRAMRLARRFYGGNLREVTVPLRFGGQMLVNRFETTNVYVWAFGIWEPGITAVLRRQMRPGEVFVDIGAHLGYFSILAAKAGATPVAVEPSPRLLPRLTRNFELNGIEGEILNVAISDKKGTATLFGGQAANTGKGSLLGDWTDHSESFEVAVDTVDCLSAHFPRIGSIKIDVEGVEQLILQQIFDHLEHMTDLETIVFELHPEQIEICNAVITAFVAQGFQLYTLENDYSTRFYRRTTFKVQNQDVDTLDGKSGTDFILSKRDFAALFPNNTAA